MLRYIEEFRKHIAIVGFSYVKIKDTEGFIKKIREEKPSNVEIQFFDAEFVVTWQHLYFAALNALTAFKNKRNLSKSVAMETMLCASAQRQIRKAMRLLGIGSDSSEMAVLIISEKPEKARLASTIVSKYCNAQRDDTVLELSKGKAIIIQKKIGISDVELETVMKKDDLENALVDITIERMALLATER